MAARNGSGCATGASGPAPGTLRGLMVGLVVMIPSVGTTGVDPVAETIRRQLEAAGVPATIRIGEDVVHASVALPGFYELRGFAPAWSEGGRFKPRARRLLHAVREVAAQGLRPTDYHLEALTLRMEAVSPDRQELAETDLLLTDAFMILAAHIVSG